MKFIIKHIYSICNFVILVTILSVASSCLTEEEELEIKYKPVTIETTNPSSITYNSVIVGGSISAPQDRNVTRGVCWGLSQNPVLDNDHIANGGVGIGSYNVTITGLNANTTYYVRAFAKSTLSTVYGNQVSVKTAMPTMATVSTNIITFTTSTSAICGGNVMTDGGSSIYSRGVCWSTTPSPTITNSKTSDGAEIGFFSSMITALSANVTYYVRAYATNGEGTAYGSEVIFKTTTDIPKLNTLSATSISATSAISGGNITNDGGATITARGVCWSTSSTPTILNSKTNDGISSGLFSSSITGLTANTTYYVRAYATNSVGTSYGTQVSFRTSTIILPTLSTSSASSITISSALLGGNITNDGGGSVTVRGVCWSTTTSSPTTSNSKTSDGSGVGSFTSSITGLTPNTTYYVRAYATNSAGTSYGPVVSFRTSSILLPTISTNSASSITISSALSGGNITNNGGGSVTARGVCWSTVSSPTTSNSKTTDGSGTGSFASSMTGLTANTTYYVRAYATNSAGTSYGPQVSFRTSTIILPTISTSSASSITISSALSGGNITNDGGGSVTVRGVCWSTTTSSPTTSNSKTIDGSGTGSFTSSITGLTPNTTYYVRAYATNTAGTAYGAQASFTTTTLSIGQSYQGGIIFYIDGTGLHGLISATTNQSTSLRWYNGSYITTGATGTLIGTGNTNTTKITTSSGTGSYAAKICYDLVLNGYSDWFLPAKDELSLMYTNLKLLNLGSFNSVNYWSSTEYSSTSSYYVSFSSGLSYTSTKSNTFYVRAIRAF